MDRGSWDEHWREERASGPGWSAASPSSWLGSEDVVPAGRAITSPEVLQRADRIRVADSIVRIESQVQEIRRGYHGLDADHCELLLAHLAGALAVCRRGLAEARADAALLREQRFGPLIDDRQGAGPAAREGEGGRLPDFVHLARDLHGRPRAELGSAAEVIQATHRSNVRQTLLQARETRLRVNGLTPGFRPGASDIDEVEEAKRLLEHPLVPDTSAISKAAPARPPVTQQDADPWCHEPPPPEFTGIFNPQFAPAPSFTADAFLRGARAVSRRIGGLETVAEGPSGSSSAAGNTGDRIEE